MSDDDTVKIDFLTDTPIFDRLSDDEMTLDEVISELAAEDEEDDRIELEKREVIGSVSDIFVSSDELLRDPLGEAPSAGSAESYGGTISGEIDLTPGVITLPEGLVPSDGCGATTGIPTTPDVVTVPGVMPAGPRIYDPETAAEYFAVSVDEILKHTKIFASNLINEHGHSKKATYIDTSLIKNSNDNFRNHTDFNYSLRTSIRDRKIGPEYEYFFDIPSTFGNSIATSAGRLIRKGTDFLSVPLIDKIHFTSFTGKVHTKGLDTFRVGMLVSYNGNEIVNDENWRKFIIGGNFQNKSYAGLLTNGSGEDTVFDCYMAPDLQEIKEILKPNNSHVVDTTVLKSVTNYSLPMYEDYVNFISDSLLIPNYYHIDFHNQRIVNFKKAPPEPPFMRGYYSLKTKFKNLNTTKPVVTPYPPAEEFKRRDIEPLDAFLGDTLYTDRNITTKKYLNTFTKTNFTPEDKNRIARRNTVYLFPFGIDPSQNKMAIHMPYYNSITIPNKNSYFLKEKTYVIGKTGAKETSKGPRMHNIFNNFINNDASILFCNLLKKHFVEQDVINGLMTKNYAVNLKEPVKLKRSDEEGEIPINVEYKKSVTNASLKYIDLYDSLVDDYEQEVTDVGLSSISSLLPIKDNIKFAKYYFECIAANSSDQDYRLQKTIPTLKLLNKVVTMTNTSMWDQHVSPFPLPGTAEINDYFPSNYIMGPTRKKYSETIGHRIEKIEINRLDQQRKSSAIQNIIILKNTPDLNEPNSSKYTQENFEYIDTQIKKGTTYRYNIYQYKIVFGYRYKIENAIVTRKIDKPIELAKADAYCLEFYNPTSFESAAAVFETLPSYKDEEAPYFTRAQIISPNKFLAQLSLDMEPVCRVYEIPVLSKEVTNTDHPPHPLEVTPYQRKDDSQIIGFHALKENFADHQFPVGTNSEEDEIIQKYLNSQNLVDGEKIINEAKSKARFVQVYRIDKKPNSIKDFNNALVATKDLKLDTKRLELSVYTDCFYEEKIKSNTKLYYTFRLVSEEGVIGSFSPIFEAELIDDGNYKYAKFHKMELNQLKPKRVYNQPSKKLKKLLQVIPTANQTVINADNLDFNNPASEQLDKITVGEPGAPIWGKKFKIRLTSKKTGKKIDLNVTYRLRR